MVVQPPPALEEAASVADRGKVACPGPIDAEVEARGEVAVIGKSEGND